MEIIIDGSKLFQKLRAYISNDIYSCKWIDGMQRLVLLRKTAINKLIDYIENKMTHHDKEADHIKIMIDLFKNIHHNYIHNPESLIENIWVQDDIEEEHLPIPVYSYIKPTMGTHFILHLLLSMGHFDTEVDLTLHQNLRESFRYAKLIGPQNDEESLQQYSNELLKKFIESQMIYFPNSKRVIDSWIVTAGDLSDEIIMHDNIPINDMPPVQQTILYSDCQQESIKYITTMKNKLLKSAFSELKEESIERCNIPTIEEILNASKENPLNWDAIESHRQNENQPNASYIEQKFATETCIKPLILIAMDYPITISQKVVV